MSTVRINYIDNTGRSDQDDISEEDFDTLLGNLKVAERYGDDTFSVTCYYADVENGRLFIVTRYASRLHVTRCDTLKCFLENLTSKLEAVIKHLQAKSSAK